jgi:hypothetical protein
MPAAPVDFFPVIVTARPDDDDHTPAVFDPAAVRIVRADDVRAGDLILASFTGTEADYFNDAYPAAPEPFAPHSHCQLCRDVTAPAVLLTTANADGNPWETCDPWPAADLVLIVPATRIDATPPAARDFPELRNLLRF